MSTITREVKHNLGIFAAKAKAAQIAADLKASSSFISSIQWNADQTEAVIKGTGFDGTFKTTADRMCIHIKLGMIARAFQAKVESAIDERIRHYFSRT